MTPPAPAQKVTVYHVATGAALLRWPVDARELVASGAYCRTRPTDPAPDLPPSGEAQAVEAPEPPAAAASPAVPGGDATPAALPEGCRHADDGACVWPACSCGPVATAAATPADAAPPKLRRPRRTRGSR